MSNQIKDSLEYLQNFMNSREDSYYDNLSCSLHEVLSSENTHNCLGCNFMESIEMIVNFLELNENNKDSAYFDKYTFPNYILLLYLVVERVDSVFNIISLPKGYKERHFKNFQLIRRWANFFKHPKSFMFVHHPTFSFSYVEGDFYIDDDFILKHHGGPDNNKELEKKLKGKENIYVLLPDPLELTKNFCFEYKLFIDTIKDNPVYKDVLNDNYTISNYIENIEEN